MAQQQQAVNKFVLGNKELEGKTAEFQYDKGWYIITDIVEEERNVIYKSRNAQEAYMKWNVYIGRKKERPVPENRKNENNTGERNDRKESAKNTQREQRNDRDDWEHRENKEAVTIAIAATESVIVIGKNSKAERRSIRIADTVVTTAEDVSRICSRIWNRTTKAQVLYLCFSYASGEHGIRTHVASIRRKPHFECGTFDLSDNSPYFSYYNKLDAFFKMLILWLKMIHSII